jgi:abhydrolase domain-containing protein 12
MLTALLRSKLNVLDHGNAGHVGQGWRTDAYRTLAAGAPDKVHVLAIDYRGFGRSTGSPTEDGLIKDGIAAVTWAVNVANMPQERIAIVGQSLGTAVATAVVEYFSSFGVEFSGVALIAPFSDLVTLLATYSIGGVIPILSPLQPYPRLQKFVGSRVVDTWHTATRLANYIRQSNSLNLILIHARDDYDIHYTHSETLFTTAANATSKEGMTKEQIDAVKHVTDLGAQGKITTWNAGAADGAIKKIKHIYLRHGGE